MTVSFEPLRRVVDGLVHGSAAGDALAAYRHRSFIAAHLVAGLLALLVIPAWLVLAGQPSFHAAIAFLWLAAPVPIAGFLSRTGRFGEANLLSALALAGLVVSVAAITGGATSPALVWLAIVPAEAALSGSRRITIAAAAIAGGCLGALLLADSLLWMPLPSAPAGFGAFTLVAAIAYAGVLALRIERSHGEAEAAARRGEARYRLLADNATDLITRHGAGGGVEFASPAARAVAGCVPAELLGHGLFNRVHVTDRPAYLRALSEADRIGSAIAAEFRLRRDDEAVAGRFVWVEMRCRPAFDPVSGERSVVAVTRDVTANKAQEDALEAARMQAENADRAKGRFLATMSHELRTPLNAIIGFSDILEQELFGRFEFQRHRDYARLIHSSGAHLLEVVNSVLDMSKIEAGSFDLSIEAFPIGPLLEGTIDMMSHQIASRELSVVRRIRPGLPELAADRRACRQILLNLLSNAVKFTEPGGTITVSAEQEGDWIVLGVADTGIGISRADLPRLGTPFVQADADYDRRYSGTGLGLSVVKGLVALHGGALSIESEPGRGTAVTIRLPLGRTGQRVGPVVAAPFEERERRRA